MSFWSVAIIVFILGVSVNDAAKCTPTATDVLGPMSSYKFEKKAKNEVCAQKNNKDDITISGRVLDDACNPVKDATINVWQTDATGKYIAGPNCRAAITTNGDGKYEFKTIHPGMYSYGSVTRPSHIHFQVFTSKGKTALTSQIYFTPGQPCDSWAGAACKTPASHIPSHPSSGKATFDIILNSKNLLDEADESNLVEAEMAVASGENVLDMRPLGQEESPSKSLHWAIYAVAAYGVVATVALVGAVAMFVKTRSQVDAPVYQEMVETEVI